MLQFGGLLRLLSLADEQRLYVAVAILVKLHDVTLDLDLFLSIDLNFQDVRVLHVAFGQHFAPICILMIVVVDQVAQPGNALGGNAVCFSVFLRIQRHDRRIMSV